MAARTYAPTFKYADWVAERARAFTGRTWLFQAIDDWLADPSTRRDSHRRPDRRGHQRVALALMIVEAESP